MGITLTQIILLAFIQGAAELLPVSSSAHVIVAEKLMSLDPSSPAMTFLLVMLHTGTMFAVLVYFWPRWKKLTFDFFKMVILATAVTGVIGLSLKKFIEKVILERLLGESHAEIEHLFKSMPLIACALFTVGLLIIFADFRKRKKSGDQTLSPPTAMKIGLVQGLCLPFRGFSRSGATISAGMLLDVSRARAEDFSFALAVVLTPPVVALELHRLMKSLGPAIETGGGAHWELGQQILPGILGMVFSFGSGLLALRWLSSWLEKGRWKYFGAYCILAAAMIVILQIFVF